MKRFGLDSGRKDILTKILSIKEGIKALSDRETYVEIGNLVFAGTGWCLSNRVEKNEKC